MSNSPDPGRRLVDLARRWFALLVLLAVAGPLGCSKSDAADAETNKPPELPYFEDGVIKLPEVFAEKAALQTAAVEMTEVSPVVHVTGVLEFDAQRLAAVGSRISGRVAEVHVIEGSKVEADQELATLVSAELGTAQAEIAAAEALLAAAERDVARKESLLAEGITSQRELDLAKSTRAIAAAQLRAARQRVQAMSGAKAQAEQLGVVSLRSPIAGDVVGVHVSRGQAVVPSHTAFMIADRRSLWVNLSVFEGELLHVQVGDPVEVSPSARPEETFRGVVAFVSVGLDPKTRSADVRVVVDNESGLLRAGQAVRANIRPVAARRRTVVVPRAAVAQIDGAPTLFVARDARTFEPRQVTLGIGDQERVEIAAGLRPEERLAVSGVFALKGELFR